MYFVSSLIKSFLINKNGLASVIPEDVANVVIAGLFVIRSEAIKLHRL